MSKTLDKYGRYETERGSETGTSTPTSWRRIPRPGLPTFAMTRARTEPSGGLPRWPRGCHHHHYRDCLRCMGRPGDSDLSAYQPGPFGLKEATYGKV